MQQKHNRNKWRGGAVVAIKFSTIHIGCAQMMYLTGNRDAKIGQRVYSHASTAEADGNVINFASMYWTN